MMAGDITNMKSAVDTLQAVYEERPTALNDKEAAGRCFMKKVGMEKVLTFLTRTNSYREQPGEDVEHIKAARRSVYQILIELTSPGGVEYEMKETLVQGGVCLEIALDIQYNEADISLNQVIIQCIFAI